MEFHNDYVHCESKVNVNKINCLFLKSNILNLVEYII